MTIRNLPPAPKGKPIQSLQFDLVPKALDRWNAGLRAAEKSDDDNTISILDPIGFDGWGDGVTAKRISAALRHVGKKTDVVVNVNSPGGDLFEGMAIYNLLREHEGKVTVKVLGLAASAASVIAMAGDEVQIARAGFLMVHNSWVLAIGNRHDLRDFADTLEPFDRAIADIYAAHTGDELSAMQKLMDAETWIGGTEAIEKGFADSLLPADQVEEDTDRGKASAVRRVDLALAMAGVPRSERKKLISEIKTGTPGAAGGGTPGATVTDQPAAVVRQTKARELLNALQSFNANGLIEVEQ